MGTLTPLAVSCQSRHPQTGCVLPLALAGTGLLRCSVWRLFLFPQTHGGPDGTFLNTLLLGDPHSLGSNAGPHSGPGFSILEGRCPGIREVLSVEVGESGTRPLESAPGRLAALLVSLQVLSAAHPGMAWHHLASQIHITLIPSKLGAGLPWPPWTPHRVTPLFSQVRSFPSYPF